MLNKILAICLIALIMNVTVSFGQTQSDKDIKQAAKIKAVIAKRGTGKEAKVSLKLKDKTNVKGYISEIKSDSFIVMNQQSGTSTEILYSQVKSIGSRNKGLAGIAVGAGVITIILILVGKSA